MTVRKYWHMELFRFGLWSGNRSLAVIGHCTLELWQHRVLWRGMILRRTSIFTRFEEMSQLWPWSNDLTEVFWAAYCKAARSSSSKYKTCHFLFPPEGAVILSHNFFVAVIRPGLLSYMCSLESIGPCISEIQNLVFSWRVIKLWGHATVTRCDGKSIFELVFMSILLRRHSQKLKLIWWKPWDKYFKVKMWNMAKMATKVKMADFLFGLADVSKRLICLLWKDRCPHSFLYMSANRGAGAAL